MKRRRRATRQTAYSVGSPWPSPSPHSSLPLSLPPSPSSAFPSQESQLFQFGSAEHGLVGEFPLTCHSLTPKFCSGTENTLSNLSISMSSTIRTVPNNLPLPLFLRPLSVACPSSTSRMSFLFVAITRALVTALSHSQSFQSSSTVPICEF